MPIEAAHCPACGVAICKHCGAPVVVIEPTRGQVLVLDAKITLIHTRESGGEIVGYQTNGRRFTGVPYVHHENNPYPIHPMPVQRLHQCRDSDDASR